MKKHIKVGLVEDQLIVRSGLKIIIDGCEDMEVIFESSDGYSVIKNLKDKGEQPDVMLVDIGLPNNGDYIYSGKHLTIDLQRHFPEIKILIVSAHDDPVTIAYMIEIGAHSFLSKDCSPAELQNTIRLLYQSGSYINEKMHKALQGRLPKGN
ncbi:MAG: response regulator [Bacteroidia bacterium]